MQERRNFPLTAGFDPFETLVEALTAVNRYDVVIGIIPVAFVLALVGGTIAGVTVELALVAWAVVVVPMIVDALYLNPPLERRSV